MRINQYSILGFFIILVFVFSGVISLSAAAIPPLRIDEGHSRTADRQVILNIRPLRESRLMKISNNEDFEDEDGEEVEWEKVRNQKIWFLEPGSGVKKVFIKFIDKDGRHTPVYTDSILLSAPAKFDSDFEINKDADETRFRTVELTFDYSKGIEKIEVSNSSNFSEAEEFSPAQSLSWTVTPESGEKTVFVRFTDVNEKTYTISHTIEYIQSARYIPEGTILKGQSDNLYYLGYDQKIHPFYNLAIFHSWYKDFSEVVYVSDAKLTEFTIGSPVCLRAGSWLVKFPTTARIYAVEPGCELRPLRSETEAFVFYGETWQKRIIELPEFLKNFYEISPITDFKRAEDSDQDGVDEETEKFYATSDTRADTDRDGVSDYEEIYFWFSDPLKKDTNANGVIDSQEIRRGLSPLSSLILETLPEGSYPLPIGTAFQMPNGRNTIYYQYDEGVTKTITQSKLEKYNAPSTFVTRSPFNFILKRGYRSYFRRESDTQFVPNIKRGETLRLL